MSNWRGVRCYQHTNGDILRVRIANTSGEWHLLTLDKYSEAKIQPEVELLVKETVSGVVLALAEYVKTLEASHQAIYLMMQYGFLYQKPDGSLQITPGGLEALKLNKLL